MEAVPFDRLGPEHLDAWHALRNANPLLDSPYFHPGFAAAVHTSGRAVQVYCERSATGAIASLFPVVREGSLLRPVGWPGADFQGPILAPGAAYPVTKLLTGGATALEFDHLLPLAGEFEEWTATTRESPFVDTTGGMDGYLARASKSGRDNMGQARRRTAKAEREIGPVKFEADVVDEAALAEVIRLKRAQYAATGARDYFAEPDRERLLRALLHTRGTDFAGILSTVYAGDRLLAAHFGIRSGPVLHWWFPVYDPAHSALAPGWILLRELVMAAPQLGFTRIDLGRGDDEYKRRAKTGETFVGQGLVTRSNTRLAVRRAREQLVAAAKASPLGPHLRKVVRRLRSR
ncbi:GNAT family N-acetyltransferase [Dactylosporangium vinaceum]|uniref:GNAT family N-acetyltransferase n=1 Tax=Dactylosporangium vinaceum TaxID=53362 RepID=A0ABV5M6R6_9ACTN|nr:GNAT family N-acetyltransferase [Dactylosporangium vinaceum]UAB97955.1 GNAT family N-acetyltransferase [Dactylosporangium vinaceum]